MCMMRLVQFEVFLRRTIRRRRAPAPGGPPAPTPPTAGEDAAGLAAGIGASYPGLRTRRPGAGRL